MSFASILLSLSLALPQESAAFGNPTIRYEYDTGAEWWTVKVRNYSAVKLLDRITTLTARSIEGREHLEGAPLITVDLDRRSLDQVLEFALGSVDLRHDLRRDAITITPTDSSPTSGTLMALASAAWVRATTLFPDSEEAPMARLSQGELAELRGFRQTARERYLSLIEDFPEAEQVDDAMMRAGRLSMRMELYHEAAQIFRELADLESEYRPAARLEYARALIELGEWDLSLLVLQNLDEYFPAIDDVERTARSIVRARALNKRGEPIEALRELDGLDESFDPLGSCEALAIRASSLEAMSMPADAARAWLAYSRDARPEERERALEQAARLSLDAGDELGTLFVCREAERLGVAGGFPTYQRKARQALGFAIAGDARGAGIVERIEHGEALLASEGADIAYSLFEDLFIGRRSLGEQEAARIAVGWATCLAHREGIEPAVKVLSSERSRYQTIEARKRLDLAAAHLLEGAGLLERAVDAYQGSY